MYLEIPVPYQLFSRRNSQTINHALTNFHNHHPFHVDAYPEIPSLALSVAVLDFHIPDSHSKKGYVVSDVTERRW